MMYFFNTTDHQVKNDKAEQKFSQGGFLKFLKIQSYNAVLFLKQIKKNTYIYNTFFFLPENSFVLLLLRHNPPI